MYRPQPISEAFIKKGEKFGPVLLWVDGTDQPVIGEWDGSAWYKTDAETNTRLEPVAFMLYPSFSEVLTLLAS